MSSSATQDVVRIAVIDTGARLPDTYKGPVRYFDARPDKETIIETGPEFKSKHGTWVTSAILEDSPGPVEILSYRVEKTCLEEAKCLISSPSILRAAQHAANLGANIIQLSSYGNLGSHVDQGLAAIAAKGIHIVIAAGNEGGVSESLPLARLNREYIHVVGSTTGSNHPSIFSARDNRDEKLLRWRRGERVAVRDPSGSMRHMTGTSYAASIMTAELSRLAHARISRPTTVLAAVDPQVTARPIPAASPPAPAPAPAPVLASVATVTKPISHPVEQTKTQVSNTVTNLPVTAIASNTIEPAPTLAAVPSDVRVDLAESGEIAVAVLTDSEKARLRSRAIRPDQEGAIVAVPPMQIPVTPSEPGVRKSRAVPPME